MSGLRNRAARSDVPMQVGFWRRLRRVLVPWWLLPAHLIGLAFREVEVHHLVFDIGDVGRGNVEMAAKTGFRGEYVVLAHALDGAKAVPVIGDEIAQPALRSVMRMRSRPPRPWLTPTLDR